MMLDMVPAGHIASVVTSLEMRERPRPRPVPHGPLRLVRWPRPSLDAYRTLFRRVGEPWLWFARLRLSDEALAEKIHAETTVIQAVTDPRRIEVGLLELDFSVPGACQIAYLGLVPEWTGSGHGRWLMHHALTLAWRPGIERVWLHSCTLDHPRALHFHQAAGFRPFARAIEVARDPRLDGTLPRTAAPHVPLIADPAP